jgi:hypothetical protein
MASPPSVDLLYPTHLPGARGFHGKRLIIVLKSKNPQKWLKTRVLAGSKNSLVANFFLNEGSFND